ncbi:MAG: hypothetical protein HY658_03670 [Actinobacteria bacterium]|nr:hypothetical protein [Actinomycetota bacterium]
MRGVMEAGATDPESPGPRDGGRLAGGALPAALFLPVLVVAAVFLAPYLGSEVDTPFGFDTPKYIWRARLVMAEGLDSLPGAARDPFRENVDRAGYPVLAGAVRAVLGVEPFELAFLLPAVAGAVVALSAAAYASWALREPRWALPVYAVAVGLSMNVVLTAGGLADNLLFGALALAVVLWALMAAEGEGRVVVGAVLLAGAVLVHWIFAMLLAGVLGLVALGLLPGSVRRASGPGGVAGSPSFRIGAVVGGGAVLGAAGLALGASWPAEVPRLTVGQFRNKLARFLPMYHLPVVAPLAAVGATAASGGRDRRRRLGGATALVWAALALPAFLLLSVGEPAPVHRILAFSLGIPLLAAAGTVWIARLAADRLGTAGRALAAAICLAGVGATVATGSAEWSAERAPVQTEQLLEAAWAGRYLEAAEVEGPVVFVVDPPTHDPGFAVRMAHRIIRAVLPADRIADAHVYLGDPLEAAAGRFTVRPARPDFAAQSRKFWVGIRDILQREPAIVVLSSFSRGAPQPPGTIVAPGVTVVRGPAAPGPLEPPEVPAKPGPVALIALFLGCLALLAAVGSGWSVTMGSGALAARLASAPAVGLAVIVVLGVAADGLGLRSAGPGGLVAPVAGAALGWLPALLGRRAGRRAT